MTQTFIKGIEYYNNVKLVYNTNKTLEGLKGFGKW